MRGKTEEIEHKNLVLNYLKRRGVKKADFSTEDLEKGRRNIHTKKDGFGVVR